MRDFFIGKRGYCGTWVRVTAELLVHRTETASLVGSLGAVLVKGISRYVPGVTSILE